MPKIHDLKSRRILYKNIERMVDSMKMVTAVRLRNNTYADKYSTNFYNAFNANLNNYNLLRNEKADKILGIVVSLNRSLLCGNYLSALNKCLGRFLNKNLSNQNEKQSEVDWVLLGDKLPAQISLSTIFDKVIFKSSANLNILNELSILIAGKLDEYKKIVLYSWFEDDGASERLLAQVRISSLEKVSLKFRNIDKKERKSLDFGYIYALLSYVLNKAFVLEEKRRLMCIDQASKNAEQIIKNLDKQINQARQAQITNELNEVINGCEAEKKF